MTTSSKDTLRTILANLAPADVLAIVDLLDLAPRPGSTSIALVALKSLKQRRKVSSFLATAPEVALAGMLEATTQGCLHAIVEALGDHADEPSEAELAAAVEVALSNHAPQVVAATLAYAVVEEFPAAPHCRALLASNPAWGLAELFASVVSD